MGNNFLSYIVQLELMAFFAGYPLLFLILQVGAGEFKGKKKEYLQKLVLLLPKAYAITGILFLGFELRNMYPDYSAHHFSSELLYHYLKIWGLLSILFLLPGLSKKPFISFLHSTVFFFILLKDLYFQITGAAGNDMISNDMKVYSFSFFLNLCTLALLILLRFIARNIRK